MQKRKLGNEGLEVSAIGLGFMGMSFSYYPFPEKEDAVDLIRKAVEQGLIFLTLLKYMDLIPTRNWLARPLNLTKTKW